MRERLRYTATMDATLLAKLDLARRSVPRSQLIEEAVRTALEQIENVEKMRERYHCGSTSKDGVVTE